MKNETREWNHFHGNVGTYKIGGDPSKQTQKSKGGCFTSFFVLYQIPNRNKIVWTLCDEDPKTVSSFVLLFPIEIGDLGRAPLSSCISSPASPFLFFFQTMEEYIPKHLTSPSSLSHFLNRQATNLSLLVAQPNSRRP